LRAALRVMRSKTYALLVTEGDEGPDARVIQPFRPDSDFRVHLGTAAGSRKVRQLAATGRAVLVYERDRDGACVVAHCTARLLDDRASRHRYFMPLWRAFWPEGPDDDFVVVRCVPQVIEVWDARRAVTPAPFGLRSARLVRDGTGWHLSQTRGFPGP
jgi:general stress protein 26